jgi:hypothetical protein
MVGITNESSCRCTTLCVLVLLFKGFIRLFIMFCLALVVFCVVLFCFICLALPCIKNYY